MTNPNDLIEMWASDVHIPYHDKAAWELFLNTARAIQPNVIHLGGDFMDFYAISRHERDPARKLYLQREINEGKLQLRKLREAVPNAIIEYREGNHENRLRRFLRGCAEELAGLDCLELPSLLDFPALEIKFLGDSIDFVRGKLHHIHGHEVNAGSVFPARQVLGKTGVNMIFGHCHRTSQFNFRCYDGQVRGAWSLGCLCDMRPEYARFNNWDQSFGIIEYGRSGHFQVDIVPVFQTKTGAWCQWRGDKFKN